MLCKCVNAELNVYSDYLGGFVDIISKLEGKKEAEGVEREEKGTEECLEREIRERERRKIWRKAT